MSESLTNETVTRIATQQPCIHEWIKAGRRESSPWMCLQCGLTSDKHPLPALEQVPK